MNKKIGVQFVLCFTIFILLLTILIPGINSARPISQEILIVDKTGNGDFTTIEEAIKNASITDIIQINRGIYNEHDLTINEKIELIGESPENTIINCSGNLAITLSSSYVDISNLQIINTQEYAISILPKSIGCSLANCIIKTNYKGIAIDIRSSYNTIDNCNLIGLDNSKQGIKIHGSYNIIRDCEIQDFSNGILILIDSNNNQIFNCNIINNENAIDIRINSNNNLVTDCNIYSNLQSIKIWQGSNNNKIYLNNFWKNDIVAIDENNNSWDNGNHGNYWDIYRGEDENEDGIGDTQYKISEENYDRFPLVNMILPDLVTHPTNVKHISSKSDTTPSFSWNPSIYNKDIKGYFVKIDNSQEIFIGETTSWTSSLSVSDGLHTFYVRAEGIDNRSSNYSSVTFPIDTTFIDTDGDDWSDVDEEIYGTDPNNPYNYPLDTDGDHIPNKIDTDDDNDGYEDEMEFSYGTDSSNFNDYPEDSDKDGIPNDDSSDGKYIGDEDDDNDGLTDNIESTLGSNKINSLDVVRIYISGKQYFLIDISQNSIYDILYEPQAITITSIELSNNNYLIDIDGDDKWDYIYNTSNRSISTIKEEPLIPIWILIILLLIAFVFVLLYYLRKKSIKYRIDKKSERLFEKPLIKESIRIPISESKETVDMITQTKALLEHIQKDVELYMEKLHKIEGQFIITDELPKEEITSIKDREESNLIVDIHDIELKVDKLIESLDDKDKN